MKIRTVLERTYRLLEDRSKWAKGAMARNASKRACDVASEKACSFCLAGAIEYSLGRTPTTTIEFNWLDREKTFNFLDCVTSDRRGVTTFVKYNDMRKTTHEDILKLLKSAIGLAKRKGV